jgi:hypothetical protein
MHTRTAEGGRSPPRGLVKLCVAAAVALNSVRRRVHACGSQYGLSGALPLHHVHCPSA